MLHPAIRSGHPPLDSYRESIDLIATEGTEITESETLLCVLGDLCGHSWDHVNRSTLSAKPDQHGPLDPQGRKGRVDRGEEPLGVARIARGRLELAVDAVEEEGVEPLHEQLAEVLADHGGERDREVTRVGLGLEADREGAVARPDLVARAALALLERLDARFREDPLEQTPVEVPAAVLVGDDLDLLAREALAQLAEERREGLALHHVGLVRVRRVLALEDDRPRDGETGVELPLRQGTRARPQELDARVAAGGLDPRRARRDLARPGEGRDLDRRKSVVPGHVAVAARCPSEPFQERTERGRQGREIEERERPELEERHAVLARLHELGVCDPHLGRSPRRVLAHRGLERLPEAAGVRDAERRPRDDERTEPRSVARLVEPRDDHGRPLHFEDTTRSRQDLGSPRIWSDDFAVTQGSLEW